MQRSGGFDARHADFIQDLAYDFYGERIATCSADHTIKIWHKDAHDVWHTSAAITDHSGTFYKLDWAHPEFGCVLAASSSDHNVIIYEETNQVFSSKKTWTERTRLVDCPGDVRDIKFAPRHLGLQLAACGEDGVVRIYEAIDVMELSVWPLKDEVQASPEACNCLSWNKSQFDPPQLVVGSECSLQIWEYYSQYRRWEVIVDIQTCGFPVLDVDWAPNLGRSYHLIAVGSKDKHARIYRVSDEDESGKPTYTLDADIVEHNCEVWRVSWNLTGTVLATSGDDGSVRMWSCGLDSKWSCKAHVDGGSGALFG